MTTIYHAGKPQAPLCNSRRVDQYHVIVLPPSGWKALKEGQRCSKCVEAIKRTKRTKRAAEAKRIEGASA